MSGFEVALISNPADSDPTKETMLPKLEASYTLALGDHNIYILGGYNTQKDGLDGDDINSYIGGLGYSGAFGPVWLHAGLHGGNNLANAGWYGQAELGPTDANFLGIKNPGTADDSTTTMGFALAAGMAASEAMQFQAGVGYISDENDAIGSKTDASMSAYLQMAYSFAPGFMVVPEIGIVDNMKDMNDNDEGTVTYAGAKWQIDF
jgi:hypothetical protein